MAENVFQNSFAMMASAGFSRPAFLPNGKEFQVYSKNEFSFQSLSQSSLNKKVDSQKQFNKKEVGLKKKAQL